MTNPQPSRRLLERVTRPLPIVRLEFVRIFAPLAVVGFMSERIWYASHWIGSAGFATPQLLSGDYRQPLYIAPLPNAAAWIVCGGMGVAGLMVALGFRTRPAALLLAVLMAFVALADRAAAFTVSKLGPLIALGLAFAPSGTRFGVDALLRARAGAAPPPRLVSWGNVRFFQGVLIAMYVGAGLCKVRGDWLERGDVLWTHLHDSYQTPLAFFMANHLPVFGWTVLQAATLLLEVFAPIWLAIPQTRPYAVLAAVVMHAMIGLMFGPVIWFSLLMMVLVVGTFTSDARLERFFEFLGTQLFRAAR